MTMLEESGTVGYEEWRGESWKEIFSGLQKYRSIKTLGTNHKSRFLERNYPSFQVESTLRAEES